MLKYHRCKKVTESLYCVLRNLLRERNELQEYENDPDPNLQLAISRRYQELSELIKQTESLLNKIQAGSKAGYYGILHSRSLPPWEEFEGELWEYIGVREEGEDSDFDGKEREYYLNIDDDEITHKD